MPRVPRRINLLPRAVRLMKHRQYVRLSAEEWHYRDSRRFWSKVNKFGPLWNGSHCWIYLGTTDKDGYGRFPVKSKPIRAHSWAYTQLIGPIPEGMVADHLCRNPPCCNPAHLEPVTGQVNNLRGNSWSGTNARKTHCNHGHEFTSENTSYCVTGGRKYRDCKQCNKEKDARRWLRKKEEQNASNNIPC